NLFKAFLEEIQKANQIKTKVQVDIVNSAWEFFFGKKAKFSVTQKIVSFFNKFTESYFEKDNNENIVLSNTLRTCLGADYGHTRWPTESEMDCSGMLVYALNKMGYIVPNDLKASQMASGDIDWIILFDNVIAERQGEAGILNFYNFEGNGIDHVNYGVGKIGNETENQIMDASYGSTWQNGRNKSNRQDIKAEPNKINKTYAPFSTKTVPVKQGYIDFSKLKRKQEK
ncbi:MAG: hypothetical protein ACI4PR_02735, partial [Acutalibacteraceae bacterium]